ncbi:hypothetical protein QQY79_04215 [Flavobacterium tructae]|uniref:Imm44 family immunity protein n=1 Tax=Flavobacterium tructae TaxID=1114873 RepID=UPI002551FC53|nr:Imm44 family immunity protein [Flavobacterium tructae]MDL2141714.1 hypothetical protein [Flavobacterium tructae]
MEFNIGTQFSKEFTFEERIRFEEQLKKCLDDYFVDKKYHSEINKMHISFICVTKEFEPFFKVRPLKVYKKERIIEYEIMLDFEEFYNLNEKDRKVITINNLIDQSIKNFKEKNVKDFNSENFIIDLEDCLKRTN